MHILVLQHEVVEHPGVFRKFLNEDGHTWVAVELDCQRRSKTTALAGEKVPQFGRHRFVHRPA